MIRFNRDINTCTINAILRRLNEDEDFKINFREFAKNITPVLQGFNQDGCLSRKTPLNIPTDPLSDDIIINSKFLQLLEHDGLAFNLDQKKQILRDIEATKKTVIRGSKGEKGTQSILRNFKQIYEQEKLNKVKNEFRDLGLKSKIKTDDQYLVNLVDISPMKFQLVSDNYD